MEKIKTILKDATAQSDILKMLKNNPEQLGKKYGLDQGELKALKSANLLLVKGSKLRSASTTTFTTGSTITGSA